MVRHLETRGSERRRSVTQVAETQVSDQPLEMGVIPKEIWDTWLKMQPSSMGSASVNLHTHTHTILHQSRIFAIRKKMEVSLN